MFAEDLLAWHDRSARDLPWCGERDAYKIWVSEIMLQQTRTETVKLYYPAFLERFPTVRALAEAPLDDVLKRWEGMGYYARARNLHKAAQWLAEHADGALPDDTEALEKLPGVGAYTARAIASIAFDRRVLAMDGNLIRVLSRLVCETRPIDRAEVKRALNERGMQWMPFYRPGDFNQALMGLGNLLCTPGKPHCGECPVAAYCAVKNLPIADELPHLPPKPDKREEWRAVALVLCEGRILVRRREGTGLLKDLWEFPNFEDARTFDALLECLAELGVQARPVRRARTARHVFTHLVWQMEGFVFQADAPVCEQPRLRYADADELDALAMPTAMRAYRELAMRLLAGD